MRFGQSGYWFAGKGPGGMRGRHGGRRRGGDDGGPGDPGERFGRRFGRRRGEWQELFGERPPRAERGGVRYLVLDALTEQPRHGYEIMNAIADRAKGQYKPSPGVIYPTLQLLEELGHVKVTERDDKKVYTITAAGRTDLAEHVDEVGAFYEQSEDVWDDHVELRELMQRMRTLIHVFRRSARRGRLTPQTTAKMRAILDEAVAKIEALLDER